MGDSMENFRNKSNEILKNIYVTDELKRKTLQRCNKRKTLQFKPGLIASVISVVLISSFVYNYFSHKASVVRNSVDKSVKYVDKPVQNRYNDTQNNEKSKEASKTKDNGNLDMRKYSMSNGASTKNLGASMYTESKNTVSQNVNNKETKPSNSNVESKDDENNNMPLSTVRPGDVASQGEPLSMESAEKYFGSKILLPSSIPEGFELSNISIPYEGAKCISIKYSSNSIFFTVQEKKDVSEVQGGRTIYIKGNKGYINCFEDGQSNNTVTRLSWTMNSIKYCVYGNLQESSLVSIANSLE